VEQVGSPLELYDRPANQFVAGFIGSPAMNFLNGRIEGGAFHIGDVRLKLPQQGAATAGDGVVYGVRPEHWSLDPDGVEAQVTLVEPTGPETQVMARLAGTQVLCAFRERIVPRVGEMIRISPTTEAVHLFDQPTGNRLN